MWKYILKRFILLFATFYLIFFAVYMLSSLAHLDTWLRGFTTWELIVIAFDNFLVFQKGIWTDFDFGYYSADVTRLAYIVRMVPTTLKLNLYAFLFYTPLGLILGVLMAYYHNTVFDRIMSFITVLLSSIPVYVTILFFMLYLGYRLGWFPGRFDHSPDSPYSFIQSITLPVLALSLGPIAHFSRILRGDLAEAMQDDYMLLCKCKGMNKWKSMMKHGLRNSVLPVLAEIPLTFTLVLSLSFIVEITYSINGAAYLMYASIIVPSIDGNYLQIDVATTTLISAFYVGMVMIISFISDISFALIDPRVKMGSKK